MLAGIADNGNSGAIVIGPELRDWQASRLMDLTVDLRISAGDPVPNLFGDSRGHPFEAFIWMVNNVYERGFELQVGDYILTGSLTVPQDLHPGDAATARYPGIGEISISFK